MTGPLPASRVTIWSASSLSLIRRFPTCLELARRGCGLALLSLLASGVAIQAEAATAPETAARVQVITLGTGGGPLPRANRSEAANAVVAGDAVYLVDCGDGCLRRLAEAKLPLDRVKAIFVTHYHQDHVSGLGSLLGIRWMMNVPGVVGLYGPPGLSRIVEGFRMSMEPSMDAGFGAVVDPMDGLRVREIRPGDVYEDDLVRVTWAENAHYHSPVANAAAAPRSYAYRFQTKAGVVVFTGDTSPTPALTALADKADLLVSEVIDLKASLRLLDTAASETTPQMRANFARHLAEDHMLPEQVGQLARDAGVGAVVLSHLSPGLDGEDPESTYAAGVRSVFGGPVSVARDLDIWTVKPPR